MIENLKEVLSCRYLARLGVNHLLPSEETPVDVLVDKFINHEKFDQEKAYNDIAIAVLKEKVTFTGV